MDHSLHQMTPSMLHETIIGSGLISNTYLLLFGVLLVLITARSWNQLKASNEAVLSSSWRFNLFRIGWIKSFFKKSWAPLALGLVPALLFILVIAAGFIEPQGRRMSIGPVITWMIWWVSLIFIITLAGKFFCAACPWEFITGLVQRFSLKRNRQNSLSANLKWPKRLGNIYLATILFVIFTWLELGYGVVQNAVLTAVLGIVFMAMSIVFALFFERRAFCRYACLVGRISGLYSLFAPVELRPNDLKVCTACRTKDCVKGTKDSLPCPTFEVPFKLNQNTYCTLCTECVRSCPHDNMVLKIRPFGTDLTRLSKVKEDESYLTIVLLVMTLFHGLTMTSMWIQFQSWLERVFQSAHADLSHRTIFSAGMLICLVAPLMMYYGFSWVASRLTGRQYTARELAIRFAFVFLPISLFYHLAHNGMHFFSEVTAIIPVLSDPFGIGWNLFGTSGYTVKPLMTPSSTVLVQILLLLAGYYYSQKTLTSLVLKNVTRHKQNLSFGYYTLGLCAILGFGVYLIHQPMVMRMS